MHDNGFPFHVYSCNYSICCRQLDCLRYLHENGASLDNWCLISATGHGSNLEYLQYVHEHGQPLTIEVCIHAARRGHLDSLKYLHEHGCMWDNQVCIVATKHGHLDCLKYAIEHGCPFDFKVKVHTNCEQYAKENGWL